MSIDTCLDEKKKKCGVGVPGWLSGLGVCLRSPGPGIEPRVLGSLFTEALVSL